MSKIFLLQFLLIIIIIIIVIDILKILKYHLPWVLCLLSFIGK